MEMKTVRDKETERERKREKEGKIEKKQSRDTEDQVEHLMHRKWTEPHKASFLCELAARPQWKRHC